MKGRIDPKKMKAIICTEYGPSEVLRMQEVENPAPWDREVPVKVRATAATIGDTIMRDLDLTMGPHN